AGLPAQPRLRSGLPLGTAIARRESGSGSSPPPDLVDSGRGRGSYRVASVFSLDVGGDPLRSALRSLHAPCALGSGRPLERAGSRTKPTAARGARGFDRAGSRGRQRRGDLDPAVVGTLCAHYAGGLGVGLAPHAG